MDPIDEKYYHSMNRLAKELDRYFNPDYFENKGPRVVGFTLFASEFGVKDGTVNYISNIARPDSIAQMKEWIARAEGRAHPEPKRKQ